MAAVDLIVRNPDGQATARAQAFTYGSAPPQPSGPHPYFDRLTADPRHWLSRSWREQSQLTTENGGSCYPTFAVDPAEDACGVWIPAFADPYGTLTATIDATQTTGYTLTPLPGKGAIPRGKPFRIDAEVMLPDPITTKRRFLRGQLGTTAVSHAGGTPVTLLKAGVQVAIGTLYRDYGPTADVLQIVPYDEGTMQTGDVYTCEAETFVGEVTPGTMIWQRAAYGTTAAPHTQGAYGFKALDSVPVQVRVKLNTGKTDALLFTWDHKFGPEMLDWPFKTWQLSGEESQLWCEVRHKDKAKGLSVRAYGLKEIPPPVKATVYQSTANRYTRYFIWVDPRTAPPTFSLIAGDAVQGLVTVYDRQYLAPQSGINQWWEEFNTSDETAQPELKDMRSWGRNWVVLKGIEHADLAGLLSLDGLVA